MHSQKRPSCSKSAITKPISGCVRIACSGLMITSLLQIVNRLAASCEPHAGLMKVVSSTCSKSADLMQLDEDNRLITQLVGNLHEAGKIHNLHQVCGVFGCVFTEHSSTSTAYANSSVQIIVQWCRLTNCVSSPDDDQSVRCVYTQVHSQINNIFFPKMRLDVSYVCGIIKVIFAQV